VGSGRLDAYSAVAELARLALAAEKLSWL